MQLLGSYKRATVRKAYSAFCVQVKWVKDARSSAYVIVQESVKGVTKRQITGTIAKLILMYALYILTASTSQTHMGLCSMPLRLTCRAEGDSGQWVPIAGFDCRGLEPIGFHPEVCFSVN